MSSTTTAEEDVVSVDGPETQQQGRITVFSVSGCPHCKAAKSTLRENGLAYNEVNLDVFPERKTDMKERCEGLTVPQIFFNALHVGGNDDLQQLVSDEGKWEESKTMLLRTPPGEDAPDPAPATAATALDVCSSTVECEPDQYLDLVTRMRGEGGVSIQDRVYHMKTYPKVFVGSHAVDWLVKDQGVTREEAVALGNKLVEKHFFHHVCDDHPFRDKYLFYRFLHDEKKHALNVAETSVCEPVPANELANKLRRIIIALYDEFLSDDGKHVNYTALGKSEAFRRYVKLSHQLQRIDLTALSRAERMAFFINIYNALVVHAYVAQGPPQSAVQRMQFFTKISYKIGGCNYSLNDIEHGILRGNKRFGLALTAPFTGNDPRLPFVITEVDPRIHFTLVCGAKGCPPIKTYDAEHLHQQLNEAVCAFFASDEVSYNEEKNTLTVTRLLQWYGGDFGPNPRAIGAWVAQWMKDQEMRDKVLEGIGRPGFKLAFKEYDWGVNGSVE